MNDTSKAWASIIADWFCGEKLDQSKDHLYKLQEAITIGLPGHEFLIPKGSSISFEKDLAIWIIRQPESGANDCLVTGSSILFVKPNRSQFSVGQVWKGL